MRMGAAGAQKAKITDAFIKEIRTRIGGTIKEREPMSRHTSFRIGGPADVWTEPDTKENLFALVKMCEADGIDCKVIGRGTNLLVREGGIRGVVVNPHKACAGVDVRQPTIKVGSGVSLGLLAETAAKNGLGGLEFCAGIPGSVGGGLAVNAGAWGQSLCDRLRRALVYAREEKAARSIGKDKVQFGYRTSDLASTGVIVEAEFELESDDPEAVSERMKQYRLQRAESQPIGFKSAGCVFKNPPGGYAGALIDALGFKGCMRGDAMVSDVHANFIVNTGEAGADDVLGLIEEIKKRALETSGVELDEEIEVVGEN